jgi:hypothetical protein
MLARLPLLSALCGCLVLFCAFGASAQAYEPGRLVLATGDTLRGEIQNNFWQDPPTFIRFRATARDTSQLLRPRRVRAVMFTDGRYFRYEALPIDHAAETRFEWLPEGFHPHVRTDSVLAEVLIEGPASMLRVQRFSTTHYLLRRPGLPVLDLCARYYLVPNGRGGLGKLDGNNYHGQLGWFFGDCPAAEQAAQRASFTLEGLAAVVRTYNEECAASAPPARAWISRARPRRPATFLWGVVGGARGIFGNISFRSVAPLPKQVQPFAGLYGEVLLPNRILAVYGELSLTGYHGRTQVVSDIVRTPYLVNGSTHYREEFVYSTVTYRAQLPTAHLGLRYYWPLPHEQQLVFGFGLDLGQQRVSDITLLSGPPVPFHSRPYTSLFLAPFPSVGLGWRTQRLTIALDAQTISSLGLRLGVSYRVGRNGDTVPPKPL